MSDSRYSFDESAEVWPYFAATLLLIGLVPTTWSSARAALARPAPAAAAPVSAEAAVEAYKRKHRRSRALKKSHVLLAVGWLVLAALGQYMAAQETPEAIQRFDPYEILGVSYSATDREIKSKYRKLSLQFHPDKVRNLVNTTREEIETKYVEMTKAYKSLTDEVTRKNYLEYGHPDGPQPLKHGIALPKFLVDETGSPVVILAYALLVGLILPAVVWSWWRGTKTYTKAGVYAETASSVFEAFARTPQDLLTHDDLLTVLAGAHEYRAMFPASSAADIKALLDAHLAREPVEDELQKLAVVAKATPILEAMLDIAAAFKNVQLLHRIVDLMQAVAQAAPPGANPLLQLPHVSAGGLPAVGLRELLALPAAEQERALGLAGPQLADALAAARTIPTVDILSAFFKVPGEPVVSPKSLAHVVIKFRVVLPGTVAKPPPPEALLEKDTPVTIKNPLATNKDGARLPLAYAQHLPLDLQPKWYAFLVNPRENKTVELPVPVTHVATDGAVSTFKIQLSAPMPDQTGKFRFLVGLRSNAFLGADAASTAVLDLQPAPEEDELEDDISDPEEDSIAGTMAQLRGGKTKLRRRHQH
ncbi:uncharacterized protein V1510DRAFT_430129 [Dipodascopsis tothii]|uniref:uncharacterized protein n=1 Tax=Dipodascopsis tothii TaxID=44089 RepID=UPI0034CE8EC2